MPLSFRLHAPPTMSSANLLIQLLRQRAKRRPLDEHRASPYGHVAPPGGIGHELPLFRVQRDLELPRSLDPSREQLPTGLLSCGCHAMEYTGSTEIDQPEVWPESPVHEPPLPRPPSSVLRSTGRSVSEPQWL